MRFNGLTWRSLSIKYLNYSKTCFLSAVFWVSNIFWVDFHKWELKSFRKFEIFRKKCIIHIVELDELFLKIWGRTLKTACGRCGAHENNANCFWDQPVTWCISDQFSDRAQAVLRSRIQIIGNSSYKLYKMYYLIIYYTLFSKNFKFTKVLSSSQRKKILLNIIKKPWLFIAGSRNGQG